ncbi:hypothetical protein ScPMuIL_017376 [Solemya velum]
MVFILLVIGQELFSGYNYSSCAHQTYSTEDKCMKFSLANIYEYGSKNRQSSCLRHRELQSIKHVRRDYGQEHNEGRRLKILTSTQNGKNLVAPHKKLKGSKRQKQREKKKKQWKRHKLKNDERKKKKRNHST